MNCHCSVLAAHSVYVHVSTAQACKCVLQVAENICYSMQTPWYFKTERLTLGDVTSICLLINKHLPGAVGVICNSFTTAAPLDCWNAISTVLGGTKSVVLNMPCRVVQQCSWSMQAQHISV